MPHSAWTRCLLKRFNRLSRWVWITPAPAECWHVVDGSRSTARHGSLSYARARIARFTKRHEWPRQHLALLHAGHTTIERRITPSSATQLTSGAGASPLAATLESLATQLRRRHNSGERRVEIHSDGLLSPITGERISETRHRCRAALQRICRAATVVWHMPVLPPRLAAWTDNLLADIPLTVHHIAPAQVGSPST